MNLLPFNRRGIYLIDTVGCLLLGAVLLTGAVPLAGAAGAGLAPDLLFWIGAALVPWAFFNLVIGLRPAFSPLAAAVNVAGDIAWVIASAALLGTLTVTGATVVAILAVGVAGIGLVKFTGLFAARRPA